MTDAFHEDNVNSYASLMILGIFEAQKAARRFGGKSVGMSFEFEIAYQMLCYQASQIPKEQRKAAFDEVKASLDPEDFKYSELESFQQLLPVWIELTRQALEEAEAFQADEKATLRRYIRMRQIWKSRIPNTNDYPVINCADRFISLKRSLLDKPIDTTNIYPGNPTRRTGPVSVYASGMLYTSFHHIHCRSSAITPQRIQHVVDQLLRHMFGDGIMFADLCEDLWTTFVLCLARSMFEVITKTHPQEREGAQSLAISFTILLHAYYPIDRKFLEPILAIVPEKLRDLSDPAVIDRYHQDIFDRFDFVEKRKGSWFHKSFPLTEDSHQYYRELMLEGMKLSEKHVRKECLGLGHELGHVVTKFMQNFKKHSEIQMYREIDIDLLEAFVEKDPALNTEARSFEYWGAFKPAWIKIAIGCAAIDGRMVPYVKAYEALRPVIVACRESFGKYPLRSLMPLEEIRSSKYFCDFNPETARKIGRYCIVLEGQNSTGAGCFSVRRTLEQIRPAYEYVLHILSLIHPSAKAVEISHIDLFSQKDKMDRYVMDVLFLLYENPDPVTDQASAFSWILHELIIELFGKAADPWASRLVPISCMLFTKIYRVVHERAVDELGGCVLLLRQFWQLMNWEGNISITHRGKQIGEIKPTDSIESYVTL